MLAPGSDPSQSLLAQAKFLVERKRYTDALKILSRALGINPEFHDLYCQMSASLEGLDRLKEALEAAEGAVRTRPTAACGHQRRSHILRQLGRLDEALKASEEALRHSPETSESHYTRALVLELLKRYDDADASAEETVRCAPDQWHGFYLKARFAERRKHYPEALDYFEKALSFDPENAGFLSGSARMLHKLKRIDEAITRYEMCIRANPADSTVMQCLRLLRQVQRTKAASKMSNEEKAAWKALQSHRTEEAHQYGLELIKRPATQSAGYRILGSVDYQRENWPASEGYFRQALERSPDDYISMNGLANALLYQGKASEAKPLYRKILDDYSQERVFRMNWSLACAAERLRLENHPRIIPLWAWGLFRAVQGVQAFWLLSDKITSRKK